MGGRLRILDLMARKPTQLVSRPGAAAIERDLRRGVEARDTLSDTIERNAQLYGGAGGVLVRREAGERRQFTGTRMALMPAAAP